MYTSLCLPSSQLWKEEKQCVRDSGRCKAKARGPWVQGLCGLQREIHLKSKHPHITKTKEKPIQPNLLTLPFEWSPVFEIAKSYSDTHLLVFPFDVFSWIKYIVLILAISRMFAVVMYDPRVSISFSSAISSLCILLLLRIIMHIFCML